MNKKLIIATSLLILQLGFGQNKAEEVSKEAKRVFQAYSSNFMEIVKNKGNKKAIGEFGKLFESGDVLVSNPMDSSNKEPISVRAMLAYIQKLDTSTSVSFNLVKTSPVKENFARNYDECSLEFLIKTAKIIKIKDSSGTRDSLSNVYTYKESMFLRMDETMAGTPFGRIVAIQNQNMEPKLPKLQKDIAWWVALSPEWQKIFRDKNQFSKYPSAKDIDGISLMFDLDLENSKMTDFSPISKIKELRKLNLSGTGFSDLSILDSCKYLGELKLSNSKVRNISKLASHTSLRKLFLNNLELKDITALANLKKMIELEASDNQINDISALAGLENLEKLNLSVNKIFKIDALGKLIKLADLRLGKNEIEGIEPLANILELIRLDIFNNKVTTLLPIKKHVKIAFLFIDFNPIKDLSPLAGFGYLMQFSMQHTMVTDLSPISKSTTMGYLNIAGSEVASLAPLSNFNVIKEFKMFNTKISKNDAAKYAKNHPGCKITYY
jgi:Leucine-rich repeat (LRR) protein